MKANTKRGAISRLLMSSFSLALTLGFLSPMVATANTGQNLSTVPETMTITKNHSFIGDSTNPTVSGTVSAVGVTPETDYVYVSMFDMDTGKYMGGCDAYRNSPYTCTVSLSGTDNTAVLEGIHNYQMVAEYFPSTQWGKTKPSSISDLSAIAAKSPVIPFERKPFNLRLETPNAFFTGTNPSSINTYLNQKVNGGYDHRLYIFDITDNRLLSMNGAQSDWTAGGPKYSFGDPHYYQSFLAKQPLDTQGNPLTVDGVEDLSSIVTSSNIISLTRNKWAVSIAPYGTTQISVTTTPGGGAYGTYLVDNANGNIIWNDIDDAEPMWAPNPSTGPTGPWATAYVARTWDTYYGGNGIKPTTVSELLDIQAHSRKYVKPAGSGTSSTYEIAGGSNPSEECSQGCQGDPINMGTGEFFENANDLITAGHGLKATASRSFSTTNKDVLGPLGYGWNPNAKLSLSSVNGMNNIADDSLLNVNQENGSIATFYKKPDGSYETGTKTQATLTRDSSTGQFTFLRDKTYTFVFDNTGKLLSEKDVFNNSLTYTYSGLNVSTVTDSHGNVLTYAYNASGLIASISDQNGQSVIYTYDLTKKLLTSVKDSTGVTFNYTYDASRRVFTLTNALGGVTTNTYDTRHRVIQQQDPLGRFLKFTYSGLPLNQTVTITQPDLSKSQEVYENGQLKTRTLDYGTTAPRTWKYYYGATNQVISVINPDNTNTGAMYDASGNMTKSIDAKGNTTTFTYNSLNKVLTATNALGHATTNTYDTTGNLLTSTDPQGNVTSFAYNPNGTLLKATDARGNVTGANPDEYSSVFSYSPKGILTQTIDAKGNKSTIGLDALGRATSTVNPRGYETGKVASDYTSTIAYNTLNLPAKTTDPFLKETNITYDSMGNVLTSKDALNNITTYTYDVVGNMLTSKNALNQVTTYHYDAMNRVDSITDANGKISTISYDTSGRVKETKDPLNRVTKQEWNAVDLLAASIDPENNRTEYSYDFAGNMTSSKDALGSITSYSYDSLNRISQVKDAEGRISKKEYDSVGRLVKTINPDGTFETIGYDAVGNPVSTTNASGKTQTWAYDSLNRKTAYVNEVNQTTSYLYDSASNIKQETRSDNSVVSYDYGRTGLLDSVDYPGTDTDLIYTYDALGRTTSEKKGTSTASTFAYDAIGQLTSRGKPGTMVSYTYDVTGNIDTITYPSGRVVTYTQDDASQTTSLQTANLGTVGFGYNGRGLPTSTTLSSGVTENRAYDATGRLTEKDVKNGVNSLYKKTQSYTATGNINQRSMTNPATGVSTPKIEDFIYDPMSRLIQQKNNSDGSAINGYAYNNSGNLTGINAVTQSFDDSGKILNSGTTSFIYDSRNNRTALTDSSDINKNQSYTWNIDDKLASVTKKVNGTDSVFGYSYGSSGLLEKKTVSGTQSNAFVWDQTSSIPLMLSDGEHEYIYGNDRVPVAQVKVSDGTVTYLHTDLNGSVTAATNASGAVSGTVDYSPYGKVTGVPVSKFGYAGDWTDPDTGYTYLRNRWLDTSTGNFLSEDPMVQVTGNSFGYTSGNPLTHIDPMGLCNVFLGDLANIGSSCYGFMDHSFTKQSITTFAGYGDGLTLGLTKSYREDVLGIYNICSDSDEYKYGGYASYLIPTGYAAKLSISYFKAPRKLYRGVNRYHRNYEDALENTVKPEGGPATVKQHVAREMIGSQYTSWTTDLDIAKWHAQGDGIIFEMSRRRFWNKNPIATEGHKEEEYLLKGQWDNLKVKMKGQFPW